MAITDEPSEVGLNPARWAAVQRLVQGWIDAGQLCSAGLVVGRKQHLTRPLLFGWQGNLPGGIPIREDAIFLVASITKPVIGAGILRLVEQGQIVLSDRVEKYVPEFGKHRKHRVTLRHLLTHTSGLPDMLPNNRELRKGQAPFSEFVKQICATSPDFLAGRGIQYQSMGIAMLGEVITRVSGMHYSEFLRQQIFAPLGMHDTALGAPADWYAGTDSKSERIVSSILPEDQVGEESWNWNSRYWRQFGAPWGGLLTTPADLARYAQMMLNRGVLDGVRVLSESAVAAATRNQLIGITELPESDKVLKPWGLAWRLHWPGRSENYGDLWSPSAYGHWGSTGTVLWIDPEREAFLVFLTTSPQDPRGEFLARCSNAVQAALE